MPSRGPAGSVRCRGWAGVGPAMLAMAEVTARRCYSNFTNCIMFFSM